MYSPEVNEEQLELLLKEVMESSANFKVDLIASTEVGNNWCEAH